MKSRKSNVAMRKDGDSALLMLIAAVLMVLVLMFIFINNKNLKKADVLFANAFQESVVGMEDGEL